MNYREVLKNELKKRKSLNKSYSLRAFARDLKIGPARLSDILNNKQGLSKISANKILDVLPLNRFEKEIFILDVLSKHARSEKERLQSINALKNLSETKISKVSEETFQVISKWYHFAIRELLTLSTPPLSIKEICKKLKLTNATVEKSLKRLENLEFIKKTDQFYRNNIDKIIATNDEIPSDTIKMFHSDILDKAKNSLYLDPLEQRNFRSIIISIDQSLIPEAKEIMLDYTKKIHSLLNKSTKRDRVYVFSSQLFPLDKI